jgi:hypothetical protein
MKGKKRPIGVHKAMWNLRRWTRSRIAAESKNQPFTANGKKDARMNPKEMDKEVQANEKEVRKAFKITAGDLFLYLEFVMESGGKCSSVLKYTKLFCDTNDLEFDTVRHLLLGASAHCDCEVLMNSTRFLPWETALPLKYHPDKDELFTEQERQESIVYPIDWDEEDIADSEIENQQPAASPEVAQEQPTTPAAHE